jgi:hypothetical protein
MVDEKKHSGLQFTRHSFMLRAKRWKTYLPELSYKFMIASALNEVTYDTGPVFKRFLIHGYLVLGRRIYIICKVRSITIETVLELFYEKIRTALADIERRRTEHERYKGTKQHDKIHIPPDLFELFPIYNEWIEQLITGQPVHLGYYDPRLARLKDIIAKQQFCSLIDHSGGQGPVIVSKNEMKVRNEKKKYKRQTKKIK